MPLGLDSPILFCPHLPSHDPFSHSPTTAFLHDGDQVIEERASGGVLQATYTYGTGIDENLTMTRGGQTYYYFHDGLGSVSDLTKSTGELVESYSYDVYGQPTTPSTIGNPYLFTGREYDQETGLYYYRARYYSPTLGRFLQRDPLGYRPDINFYRYVTNNPVTRVDPYGFKAKNPYQAPGNQGNFPGDYDPSQPGGPQGPIPSDGDQETGVPPDLPVFADQSDEPWWRWFKPFIPPYGNYGGPMNEDPLNLRPPVDSIDRIFQKHDRRWRSGDVIRADRDIYRELINLPSNPRDWNEPAKNPWGATFYRRVMAEPYFWWTNFSRRNRR